MNYRLTLQYDGTDFHGWQMQGDLRTVQSELTRALSLIDNNPVIVHGAGRTDAGVHAEEQIANAHLRREIAPEKLRAAINGNTGRDLRVVEAAIAPEDFHARQSAIGKTYRYRVYLAPFISPFWLRYALHEARPLDTDAMRAAANLLTGTHDWSAFSSVHTAVRTRVRKVTELAITEREVEAGRGRVLEITVSADGFLRYMVRSLAGTLLGVGRGEINLADVERALSTGERALAGATAAPQGLTLVKVHYAGEH
ncbi:MAG TPA: tRNA pseudouridine(38-40) synthase TruA [Pyrinomonadaceae bacterium]|nr:tRNA pseudouridine(38-40) synthase TruA [Pyrinomonadaceae bacterium]